MNDIELEDLYVLVHDDGSIAKHIKNGRAGVFKTCNSALRNSRNYKGSHIDKRVTIIKYTAEEVL